MSPCDSLNLWGTFNLEKDRHTARFSFHFVSVFLVRQREKWMLHETFTP